MNLKDYFSFTRKEKRGVVFLLFIISLLIISIPLIRFFEENKEIDFSEFETAIIQFEKEQDSITNHQPEKLITLFKFNPNTISDKEWLQLGFKKWQIKTINNYKAKGGNWRIKSDLKKIYGLKEEHYKRLKPFILLPDTIKKSSLPDFNKDSIIKKKPFSYLILDINTADTSELKQLKGIGSVYANRIIKYRNSLGGFIRVNQIKEVYGISEKTYLSIEDHLIIQTINPLKINLNKNNAEELKKHPYIDWKIANIIEKYRKVNGNYQNIDDLKKIHLINEETFLKIAPYLSIN